MKRIIFALLFVSLLVLGASLIPDTITAQYPSPTQSLPSDPYPIWFGIYCNYQNSGYGLIRVKWDFPPGGWQPNPDDAGYVRIYYNNLYETVNLQLNENGVTKLWSAVWHPISHRNATILGYVHGANGSSIRIQPSITNQYCPEPVVYLPFIRK